MKKKNKRINKLIAYLMVSGLDENSRGSNGASFTELKKEIGINDTELNNILHKLMDLGIIIKDDKTGYYYLGRILADRDVLEKINDKLIEIIKLISDISGIKLNDYESLKDNIDILINYLLK